MRRANISLESEKSSSLSPYLLLRIFFAACIILGPVTFFVYGILAPQGRGGQAIIAANIAENPLLNQLHLLFGVLASFFLPIGFLGLSLLALRRSPWLGSLSVILSLPGWTPLSGLITLDALSYDIAQIGGGPQFVALWNRFNSDAVLFSYTFIYAVCHLLCAVLVGIALGRTRLIPLWAAVAIILFTPLLIIGFPTHLFILLLLSLVVLEIGSLPAALVMLKGRNELASIT